mgnify:CR=1 FL=1
MSEPDNRCRLVLILPQADDLEEQASQLDEALGAGDVATVILPQYGRSDQDFQVAAERLVPIVQAHGAAALIAGDSRTAGRAKADGIHFEGPSGELHDVLAKHTPKMIVGTGGATDRHKALELGEAPWFAGLRGDPRFERLRKIAKARLQKERRETEALGLI